MRGADGGSALPTLPHLRRHVGIRKWGRRIGSGMNSRTRWSRSTDLFTNRVIGGVPLDTLLLALR